MRPVALESWKLSVVLFAAVLGALWTAWFTVGTGSAGRPSSLPSEPAPTFASQVVHFRVEQFMDYGIRRADGVPQAARLQRMITDRWVELDETGTVLRYKNVTTAPDGALWQEQLYTDGVEHVNFYQGSFGGGTQSCSVAHPTVVAGSTLPVIDATSLPAAGFGEVAGHTRAQDLAVETQNVRMFHRAREIEDPRFSSIVATLILDADSGFLLAELSEGVGAEGTVLRESRIYSSPRIVAEDGVFVQDSLQPCGGTPPSPASVR
jgi:hypothetical protein